MLAWTLALLIAPALASATCSGATTTIFTQGVDTNWSTGGNWFPTGTPPDTFDHVCIPSGTTVTLSTGSTITDIDLESGATMSISGPELTVGSGISSTLSGVLTIEAPLVLDTNTVYDAGSMTIQNGGTLTIKVDRQLQINNGVDVGESGVGPNTVDVVGDIQVNSPDINNPTVFDARLEVSGTGSNSGPMTITNQSLGNGQWTLGSGDGGDTQPTLTVDGGQFSALQSISDAVTGGLGRIVIKNGGVLQQNAPYSHFKAFEVQVESGGSLDLHSSFPITTASAQIAYLTVSDAGSAVDTNMPLTVQTATYRDGDFGIDAPTTVGFFHWGGGNLNSGSAHGGPLTVQGTFDMTKDTAAGDTGTRFTNQVDVNLLAGTGSFMYDDGTLDIGNSSDLEIGPNARFSFTNDVNITRTGTGTITNHGIFEMHGGGLSQVTPPINMPDGEIDVTTTGTLQLLVNNPVQFTGSTLSAGTYKLTGTLDIPGPGPMTSLGNVQFLGPSAQLIVGGVDAMTTINSNPATSTLTLANGAILSPAGGFTNDGVINLSGNGSIFMQPGQKLSQTSAGARINLSSAGSTINTNTAVDINAGTLSGIGTINGSVNNFGTVAPGNSPGTLSIIGNYTQGPAGTLVEEVAGTAAGQFDLLQVAGTATLDGTLQVLNFGGFDPGLGNSFVYIAAGGGVNGTFASVQRPGAGLWYSDSYGGTFARLAVNGVTIADSAGAEGGTVSFPVTLDHAETGPVSVDYTTAPGSADAADFTPASGTVTFAPGETAKTISVQTAADSLTDLNEDFSVTLSNPVGTRIARATATGTITGPPTASTSVVGPDDIDGFLVAPPPVQGKKVNVEPVSGIVTVKLPGRKTFVRLPDREQVPVGTIVDTRKGVVRLFSAGKGGKVQSAIFYDGVFQVLQKVGQALTRAKLVSGNFVRACGRSGRAEASAKRRKKAGGSTSVRHLWSSGSGEFRTEGRFASATIRGTKWLTDDRCNGTLIRVTVGAVTVRDLTLKKTIVLKKPKRYLAPAVKPKQTP